MDGQEKRDLRYRYRDCPDFLKLEEERERERENQGKFSPKVAALLQHKQDLRKKYRYVMTATAGLGGPDLRKHITDIRLRHFDEAAAKNPAGLDDREIALGRKKLIEDIGEHPDIGGLQQELVEDCLNDFSRWVDYQTGKGRRLEAREVELAERFSDMPISEETAEIMGSEVP